MASLTEISWARLELICGIIPRGAIKTPSHWPLYARIHEAGWLAVSPLLHDINKSISARDEEASSAAGGC